MECLNCGRGTQQEDANFCYYCGQAFRGQSEQPSFEKQIRQGAVTKTASVEPPVSTWNWLVSYGVLLIPIVGFIVLIFWSFDKKTITAKKNWARATLVFMMGMIIYLFIRVYSLLNSPEMRPHVMDFYDGKITQLELMDHLYENIR